MERSEIESVQIVAGAVQVGRDIIEKVGVELFDIKLNSKMFQI